MIAPVFIPIYHHGHLWDWAWIDAEDAQRVSQYRWSRAGNHAIAGARLRSGLKSLRGLTMHRFVLGLGRGDGVVHHINEDGIDNRRSNLRYVKDMAEHWEQPHPRWRRTSGRFPYASLPPHDREISLAARHPA